MALRLKYYGTRKTESSSVRHDVFVIVSSFISANDS